jgi:hypothetical protein
LKVSKKDKNRIDYTDGADLIANEAIEQIILNGQLRAYGLEVLFPKNNTKTTANFILYHVWNNKPGRLQTFLELPPETGSYKSN